MGSEDQFIADILNHIVKRVRARACADETDTKVFEDGVICGKGDLHLDVYADPKNPRWVKMDYVRIDPLEVKWDPASKLQDRTDARYFFWDKWLSREEFKAEYPDHADKIEEVLARENDHSYTSRFNDPRTMQRARPDRYRPARDLTYYDRYRDLVRVIHMEYKLAKRRFFVAGETGTSMEVDEEVLPTLRDLYDGVEVIEAWDTETHWLEFIGDMVLFDDVSPMPYDGFGVSNYTVRLDFGTGLPYGKVRNLCDPQREVNKRHSQMLNLLASQTQPGVFAELTAVPDKDEFERSLTDAGSTSWLNTGGLERVRAREVPAFPEAPARLFDVGMKMVEVISGIFTDELTSPRGIPEAAATAQLKHRKSNLMQIPLQAVFEAYQKAIRRKEVETIVCSMPDDQIAAILGNDKKYRVESGVVVDNETGNQVELRNMRTTRFDVAFEIGDGATSQRLLELQTLVELQKSGIPVDPSIIVELTTLTADKKARLAAFAAQAQQAAQQAEASKAEALLTQLERQHSVDVGRLRVEGLKAAEGTRHNIASEILGSIKAHRDYDAQILSIWEKADSTEKSVLQKLIDAVLARQEMRGAGAQRSLPGGA